MSLFIALLMASLVMMTVGYMLQKAALAFSAAGLWIVFAVQSYTLSATPSGGDWDVYYAVFWLACAMVLVCALEPAIMKPRPEDTEGDIFVDDIDRMEQENDRLMSQTRIPRLGYRGYRSRRHANRPRTTSAKMRDTDSSYSREWR